MTQYTYAPRVANGRHESAGVVSWLKDGLFHRDDGPAQDWQNGTQVWFQHGKRHREDGPAFIRSDGVRLWYLTGREYTFNQYCKILNLSPEAILELRIRFDV